MNGYSGDVSFTYNLDKILLGAQILPTGIKTETDSDFLLLGLILNTFTSILFSIQLRDASGNYFSSSPVLAANYGAQGPLPYTFQGQPRVFPPGSLLSVDLVELSGVQNTIQLGFIGIKQFTTPAAVCGPGGIGDRMVVR